MKLHGLSFASAIFAALLLTTTNAAAVILNFNSGGYASNTLESAGTFTWTDVGGSGVDVTWSIAGNPYVNDIASATGLRIGRNMGFISGFIHQYNFSFSKQ